MLHNYHTFIHLFALVYVIINYFLTNSDNSMHTLSKFIIILFFILYSGCGIYKPVDAKKVSPTGTERAEKNIEEGRGISLKGAMKGRSTTYDFSTEGVKNFQRWYSNIGGLMTVYSSVQVKPKIQSELKPPLPL